MYIGFIEVKLIPFFEIDFNKLKKFELEMQKM